MKIEAEATITPISVNFPRAAELTSISVGHLRRMAAKRDAANSNDWQTAGDTGGSTTRTCAAIAA